MVIGTGEITPTEGDSPQKRRAAERSTELTPRSATKGSCSCSCSKRGGINWTGFVCPLRSECFVGRRFCGIAFVRHLLARRWVGRGLRPPDVSSFCELLSFSRLCP